MHSRLNYLSICGHTIGHNHSLLYSMFINQHSCFGRDKKKPINTHNIPLSDSQRRHHCDVRTLGERNPDKTFTRRHDVIPLTHSSKIKITPEPNQCRSTPYCLALSFSSRIRAEVAKSWKLPERPLMLHTIKSDVATLLRQRVRNDDTILPRWRRGEEDRAGQRRRRQRSQLSDSGLRGCSAAPNDLTVISLFNGSAATYENFHEIGCDWTKRRSSTLKQKQTP